jgi:PAS domain S-box-containing protein
MWQSREAQPESSHEVLFYDATSDLVAAAGAFLAAGLSADEPVVVIATGAHCGVLCEWLGDDGFDVVKLEQAGVVTLIDAGEMLARLVIRGRPNDVLFQRHIGALIARRAGQSLRGRVRVYGEMVDLLFQAGDVNAAVKLEEMWNELQRRHTFSLLCAYVARSFDDESDVRRICATHTHVQAVDARLRAEGCAPCAVDLRPEQMRAIVAEISLRKEVEGELRATVQQLEAAREALRRTREELQQIAEDAALGLHGLGSDGTILWANRAELEMLGYDASEYVGHKISDFHVDAAVGDDILARLCGHQTVHEVEARLLAKDGSLRHVIITASAGRREGDLDCTRCSVRDVTEMKHAEDSAIRTHVARPLAWSDGA